MKKNFAYSKFWIDKQGCRESNRSDSTNIQHCSCYNSSDLEIKLSDRLYDLCSLIAN